MRSRVAAALTVLVVLAAAGSSFAQTGTQETGGLVLVNGIRSAEFLDYRVDGEVVAEGVAGVVATSPVRLPAGDYEVTATESDDADVVIVSGRVTVVAGRTVLFANHLDGAGKPTVLVGDVAPTGLTASDEEAEFVAFHAAQAGLVSFRVSGAEAQQGLSNGTGDRKVIGAGRNSLTAVLAGEGRELARADGVEVEPRGALVALLVGSDVPPDDGFILVTFTVPPLGTPPPEPGARATSRIAGPDRIRTAIEIAKEQFPDGADVVYLARADEFADALAGGSLTAGPILLVPPCDGLPEAVAVELDRLDPETVTALGGEDAVCEEMLQQAAN